MKARCCRREDGIVEASSGPEALCCAGRDSAIGLVLADRRMPGMDGLAFVRALRERRAGAILIDTSPRPQDSAREFALALDARYVALPQADAGALAAAVRALA